MERLEVRELTLENLEEELDRVKKAKEITEQFLNTLNSLSEQKVTELQNLKSNLELLKDFEKKEGKEKFIQNLTMRETSITEAVQKMKQSGSKIYDPRSI